jgi:hypothetical protein
MPPGLPGGKLSQKYCAKPVDLIWVPNSIPHENTQTSKAAWKQKYPKLIKILKKKNAQIQVVQFAPTSAEILTWAHNLGPFTSRSASGVSDRSTSQSGILSTA